MNHKRLFKILSWKLISLLPAREMTLETRNGKLTFNTKDYLLGKHLYADGNYEFEMIQRLPSILEGIGYPVRASSGILVDAGANIGMITIGLMQKGWFSRALAFEPDPFNFSLLRRNVQQNGLQKAVQCFNFALSSEGADGELELASDNFGDHRIRQSSDPGFFREQVRKTVSVPLKPLDSVLDAAVQKDVALIWLDIQGHEGYFFKGAEKTILTAHCPVLTEFWPYGIQRSGISREEYCELIIRLFENYIHLTGACQGPVEPTPSFAKWFDIYSSPREMGVFLFFSTAQISERGMA